MNEVHAPMTRTLLVVESNPDTLALIHKLERPGQNSFTVIEAKSCKSAMKLVRTANPSCCLLCYHQPLDEIRDFLKALRRSKLYDSMPVILLADEDQGDPRSTVEIMHQGAKDYLIRSELTERSLRRSVMDAIYMCEFQKNLHQLAHYDQLTGLLNRSLFLDRLENAIHHCNRYQQNCSLLYIDVDNFKVVNDCYGHEAGDRLLQTIAERIKTNCRNTDSAARLGGDEFAILISRVDKDKANKTAAKLLEKVSEPVELDAQTLHVSLSIGIAHYPDTAGDMQELMEQADQAMYRAKEGGKARYFQFSQNQKQQLERRNRLETMLPEALAKGELTLQFQPIVHLDDRSFYSMNALASWSPGRYKVTDEELHSMVRSLSLNEAFYRWLIDTSLAVLVQQQAKGQLCLNLPVDYCDSGLLTDYLPEKVSSLGLQPEQIEIEITEKILMEDVEHNRKLAEAIKSKGFRLCVDDFDLAHSSVDDLTLLPLDSIKINSHFFTDVAVGSQKYRALELATLLGHSLGLNVIAKGVGDANERRLVEEIGCDLAQGDDIAAAVPITLEQAITAATSPVSEAL